MNNKTDNFIEIAIDVQIQGGIAFWIDKSDWEAMNEAEKRNVIDDRIGHIASKLANDVLNFGNVQLSAAIVGPEGNEIDLTQIRIYESEE